MAASSMAASSMAASSTGCGMAFHFFFTISDQHQEVIIELFSVPKRNAKTNRHPDIDWESKFKGNF